MSHRPTAHTRVTERKNEEKSQRRTTIVDAAERLFFKQGFAATTMDAIAQEARLAKGTLYLHAQSKSELYHAVVLRGMQVLVERCEAAVAEQRLGIDRIAAFGAATLAFFHEHTDYFMLMTGEPEPAIPDEGDDTQRSVAAWNARLIGGLTQAIAHGQQDGTIRRDVAVTETALAMAYTVPRLIRATFPSDTMLRGHLQTSAEAVVTSYFDLLRHALSAGDVAD